LPYNYTLAQLLFLQLPIAVDSHAQMSDHQAAAENILQTFCQICLRAVTAERDCNALVQIAQALEENDVKRFFEEYPNMMHVSLVAVATSKKICLKLSFHLLRKQMC